MVNRSRDTREAGSRKASWTPPTVLPDPIAERGYTYRWVRIASLGSSDNRNFSKRSREGWVPVAAKDHPELQYQPETFGDARFQDGVEIGGLLLCKTATENVDARNEYYNTRNVQQMESVDNDFLRDNNPLMPKLKERRSRVTFGNSGE